MASGEYHTDQVADDWDPDGGTSTDLPESLGNVAAGISEPAGQDSDKYTSGSESRTTSTELPVARHYHVPISCSPVTIATPIEDHRASEFSAALQLFLVQHGSPTVPYPFDRSSSRQPAPRNP